MMDRSKFWDKIAERYAKQPIADEAAYRKKLQVARDYLKPDMQVLEFGCGTGSTAIAHAPFVRHIHAIDISARMIAIAQARATASDARNITFARTTLDDIEIADESCDAVFGLNILHLLDDWQAAIAKAHRLLKPGGIFVTSTACLSDMTRILRIALPVGRALGLVPPVAFFSRRDLRDSVSAAGFRIEHDWQPGKGKAVFLLAARPI